MNLAPTEPGAALSLDQVHKRFRTNGREVKALDGINLQVQRGAITGLIGPDAAGKTTLMRLVAGLLLPDSGRITVLGRDVAREALQIQAQIGYMPQRFGLYEDLSVQENLDLYADLQGVPHQQRSARYRELMHMTGLAPFTRRLAGRLSGGMKQKLGLACTLVRSPELLLLDEPTAGVDPVSRRELWAIVERLVRDEQMTVLLSTAYLDEAERCRQVILLHQGRVLGQGSPASFSEPLKRQTFLLDAGSNSPRRLQSRLATTPGVLDAVIIAGQVHLLLSEAAAADPAGQLPDLATPEALSPTAPRFEDGFVARLKTQPDSRPGNLSETVETATPQRHEGSDPIIAVKDLSRRFGNFYAVNNISFDVRRGEVFGLLGANGAGKSTTFRMLCGLLPASAGSLQVAGLDLRRAAAKARARIGYMSQKFSLYGNLSVLENLRFFASSYGLSGKTRQQRTDWARQAFDLEQLSDTASGELPLGYKQRLAMACALMHQPDILFLDEPTSGVDPLARREFWQRINALAEGGVTVLVTTHFMEEAEYCDRLAIMAAGEILALGTPAQIKTEVAASGQMPTMEEAFIALIERAGREENDG